MQNKVLTALFDCVGISGDFLPISEANLLKETQLSAEQLNEIIPQLLKDRLISIKKCQTGRNFYCITKRGETKMNEKLSDKK